MSKEVDPITRLVMEGLGENLRKYRKINSKTRAELAKELGVGETRIKQFETDDFKNVGAGGFHFGFLARFALLQDKNIVDFLNEILEGSDVPKSDAFHSFADSKLSDSVKNGILEESQKEEEPLGNSLKWLTDIALLIRKLPLKDKVGLEIDLRNKVAEGKDKTRLRKLYNYQLES